MVKSWWRASFLAGPSIYFVTVISLHIFGESSNQYLNCRQYSLCSCTFVPDNRETLPIFNLLQFGAGQGAKLRYYMLVLVMQTRSKTLSTFSFLLQVGPMKRCMLFLHISPGQTRSEVLSMFIPFVEECMSHCSLEQSVILNYGVRTGSV